MVAREKATSPGSSSGLARRWVARLAAASRRAGSGLGGERQGKSTGQGAEGLLFTLATAPFPLTLTLAGLGGQRRGGFLDDHVRVGAAGTEGGDAGPAGAVSWGPGALLAQELDLARAPVDLGGGGVEVQGLRQRRRGASPGPS